MLVSPDYQDVRAFHVRYNLPSEEAGIAAHLLAFDVYNFRVKFLHEERDEFTQAFTARNLIKTVDALLDFVYVVHGTALFMQAPVTFFPTMPFPNFDGVRDQAMRFGFLGREVEGIAPRRPDFLTERGQTMIHDRMLYEVTMFEQIHNSSEPYAIPLSIAHLWNAAYAGYFGAVLMNVPWAKCWQHVQAANMAKQRAAASGEDSKRDSKWDVIKPRGWTAPDARIGTELLLAGASLPPEVLEEARRVSLPKE